MNELFSKIQQDQATGFTHGGKFHADDVFASALLLHLNPDIEIKRGNHVPEDFSGIVFDIGRGRYDHHQRDSRIRENGVPYAAFGLLWEELGAQILGEELAARFDEEFVQPLDLNDNTGEKNELAALIGDFNPTWDDESDSDLGFFQAVGFAEMILNNKFVKYKSNEKADVMVGEYLAEACVTDELSASDDKVTESGLFENGKVVVLSSFVPFQKKLTDTEIAFAIFPSNRGGYCIQPIRKADSMNNKCCFPEEWLGLDGEELQKVSGLESAQFCHKGGFIMTVLDLEDAKKACQISLSTYVEQPHIVIITETEAQTAELKYILHSHFQSNVSFKNAILDVMYFPEISEIEFNGQFGQVLMEKQEWKQLQSDLTSRIKKRKPEAVIVDGSQLFTYPLIHQLRKKKIPAYVTFLKDGEKKLIRIPSGS